MTQQHDQTTPMADEARLADDETSDIAASSGSAGADVDILRQEVDRLQARLGQESAQATDYMHKWQRSAADFINYKRRSDQEREDLTRFANQAIITQLLAVLDNFDRAFATIPPDLNSLSWVTGVRMIQQQFHGVLMQQGLQPVVPVEGDAYDPRFHEAVVSEPADDVADGTILSVFQVGYTMHQRLLRPAMVKVARGGATMSQGEGNTDMGGAQPAEGGTGVDTPQPDRLMADETA